MENIISCLRAATDCVWFVAASDTIQPANKIGVSFPNQINWKQKYGPIVLFSHRVHTIWHLFENLQKKNGKYKY